LLFLSSDEKDEMRKKRSINLRKEKCMQGFRRKSRRTDSTRKKMGADNTMILNEMDLTDIGLGTSGKLLLIWK
jgi:hypothetical protein